jgi:hypothetical protein
MVIEHANVHYASDLSKGWLTLEHRIRLQARTAHFQFHPSRILLAQLNPQVRQIGRLPLQETTIRFAQPFLLQPVLPQVSFNVIEDLRSKLDDPVAFDQKLL